MTSHYETIIVGAGLSGLTCALKCQENNIEYCLIEKQSRLGGRIGSIVKDGFVLDLGFQVYNTSYSLTNDLLGGIHTDFLRFQPGAAVHINHEPKLISDPFRDPWAIVKTLMFSKAGFKDYLRLFKLRLESGNLNLGSFDPNSISTRQYLEDYGFSKQFIEYFLQPFFSGVFLEKELVTSSQFFKFVFSSLNHGYAVIPNGGMQEIPDTIARNLEPGRILLGVSVECLLPDDCIRLSDGRMLSYDQLVLTGESINLSSDLKTEYLPACTLYFVFSQVAPFQKYIHLFPEDDLINNAAFLTAISPGYSSSNENLVSVTVLGDGMHTPDLESIISERLSQHFGGSTRDFRHVHTFKFSKGTLFQKPGFFPSPKPNQTNLIFAGELFTNGSIEGAVQSGLHAFEALLQSRLVN